MSGKSCASGSVRSCGGSVRVGTATGHEVVLDALYDRKRDNKSVRVLTVIVYVFCVSLAAIMLSLYYVFFWEPKDAQYAQRKVLHTVEQQTTTTPMPTCFMPHTGRSDSTVESLGESGNITTTGGAEMGTDAESGHVASMAAVHVDSGGNTTSLYETGHVDSGGNTTGIYDTSTVDYSETPTLSNDNETGT